MSEHTPGPWVIGAIESGQVAVDGANGEEVTGWVSPEDGQLIAAAPELLEALQAAIECNMVPISSAKNGGPARHSRQVQVADMIRAAIAKATGKQT